MNVSERRPRHGAPEHGATFLEICEEERETWRGLGHVVELW